METLTVHRGDLTLEVLEAPDRELWDFWGRFAAGQWEPETFEVLDRMLTPDGCYVDVGAWIGPTVLYAARLCREVVAVEPDPVAWSQLIRNLSLNGVRNVTPLGFAVDDHKGNGILYSRGGWGDSMSTTMIPSGDARPVPTMRLADLIGDDEICLIKIDIEGAESRVLPDAAGFLAARRIPCLVSLHEPWWPPGAAVGVADVLARFDKVTVLDNDAPWGFRTVLAEWE